MITHRIKNIALLVMAILLLISGTLNFIQVRNAKQEQLNAMLRNEQANTAIAASRALAKSYADRAREVDSLRILERDSVKVAVSGLKMRLQALREKDNQVDLEPWGPLMVTIDTAGYYWQGTIGEFNNKALGCLLKDTIIQVQDSLISTLELTNMSQERDFEEIIRLNRAQINEQVDISNQLQNQLVESQTQTRKEVRRKKFFRTLSVISLGAVGVLLLKPN